eukprot:CAMPEP_0197578268 /NCGR_PEP_ID=MMETSP1326-20131121/2559_1 /TAXON_ID=1155430 /ORGANISM="Genus nov. species nov., Strain RCC2288" /LENGTH=421 /DNA_ID=CAMNT_0043141437 /DNA_START=178 /DNA_END=1439 /DNA_ORIENTATION=-
MTDELPPLDLEVLAANYSPTAAIARLCFVADRAEAETLQLDALRMAADLLKQGDNTKLYTSVVERIAGRLGAAYELDRDWVDEVDRRAAKRQEILDAELNGYKTNMIKESIRMGHNDLGDFFYQRGDLNSAFKCYVRTRDYCTTSRHVVAMCLNVVRVSIESENFVHVQNYVQKASQVPDVSEPAVLAKLGCAAGLAALESRKYKMAARKFTELAVELEDSYSEVISPQDVATYGGLCALASLDRKELKERVLDNITFRAALEVVPEVRELINDFYASRYPSCLACLEKMKPALALDIHLHDHVESLYEQIRHRALIQYTTPYTVVDLAAMAHAFRTDTPALEKELAALIMDEKIAARIDSQSKILYARHANQRNATYARALATGREFRQGTHAMLIRASLLKNDCVVRGAGGGGGGRERG